MGQFKPSGGTPPITLEFLVLQHLFCELQINFKFFCNFYF